MDTIATSKNNIKFLLHQISQIVQASGFNKIDMENLVFTCMNEVHNPDLDNINYTSLPAPKLGLSTFLIKRLVLYIDDHISTNIRLADIANLVGLSPYYFARSFTAVFGASPYQYILMRRIELAKVMMLRREGNLLEIAISVGFAGSSQFSRAFRKITGKTPSRWSRKAVEIKSMLENIQPMA